PTPTARRGVLPRLGLAALRHPHHPQTVAVPIGHRRGPRLGQGQGRAADTATGAPNERVLRMLDHRVRDRVHPYVPFAVPPDSPHRAPPPLTRIGSRTPPPGSRRRSPGSLTAPAFAAVAPAGSPGRLPGRAGSWWRTPPPAPPDTAAGRASAPRSEERRGGKEGRSRAR